MAAGFHSNQAGDKPDSSSNSYCLMLSVNLHPHSINADKTGHILLITKTSLDTDGNMKLLRCNKAWDILDFNYVNTYTRSLSYLEHHLGTSSEIISTHPCGAITI